MALRRNRKKSDKKRPTVKKSPSGSKEARRRESPESNDRRRIHWHLSAIDFDGPWCVFHIDKVHLLGKILGRLRSFESMTWGDLGNTGSHSIETYKLCREARRRLEEIGQDDIESLFSLRFSGKERLWGIRDRAAFRVLWWDPEHEICPSAKKYT